MWCYISAATLVKISVLLFYRRLSVKFSKLFLIATWIGIVYNILYFIAFGLALILICSPTYAYWKSFDFVWASFHKFRCNPEGVSLPASAAFSVLSDFYSTLLPVLLIFNLELPRKQKLALYALFALGFLAVVAGIVRTVLLYLLLNKDYDFMWVLWETWIWAIVEIYVAIFAASAPALKPFFRRFLIDSIGSIGRNSRRRGTSQYALGEADQKTTWVSSASKETGVVDVERIGVAVGGNEREDRERGFLRDMEQEETRHFELRASRDGKIIPMQVYKRSTSDGEYEYSNSNTTQPTEDWPMPPMTSHSSERYRLNMGAQQPIHVGIQIGHLPPQAGTSNRGSVAAARLRAQSQRNPSRDRRSGLNPRPFEDMHDDLASGSRLESPSGSEDGSIYDDEKPPWNTIVTSSTGRGRERSDSGDTHSLHLPRMGSRDFDVEKRRAFREGTSSQHVI